MNTDENMAEYFKTKWDDDSDSSNDNIDQTTLSVILMEQYPLRFENIKHM